MPLQSVLNPIGTVQPSASASGGAEPMQVDAAPEESQEVDLVPQHEHIVETTNLDLELYASQYSGLARLYRLIYVADHCPQLRVEALKMALTHVMNTYNVSLYVAVHKKLLEATQASAAGLPDAVANSAAPSLDQNWIETTNKKSALKLEKLDTDLKNYKCNSIKESIRRGHDDLGDHYLDSGDLSNALKCYSRSRDYCTTSKHVINMCLNVIRVSIYLQNWSHVLSYVNKAEATPHSEESTPQARDTHQTLTQLKCAAGLAELSARKYKSAAKYFLQASVDHCDEHLLSPANVAVYGGLCGLATFDRQELQRLVINSVSFKQFLELDPTLRDVVNLFNDSKYAACLNLLSQMKDNLMLDMYLAPHVKALYARIRHRGLCQYFSPYSSADLRRMSEAFTTPLSSLEEEIGQLIQEGQINARIDSHKKVLRVKNSDARSLTFEKALSVGAEYQRRVKALIVRAAVIRQGLSVKVAQGVPQDGPPSGSDRLRADAMNLGWGRNVTL